jgi:hypothetical protein
MSLGAVFLPIVLLAAGVASVSARAQDRPGVESPRPRAEEPARQGAGTRRSQSEAPAKGRAEPARPQPPAASSRAPKDQPRGAARPVSPAPDAKGPAQAEQPAVVAPDSGPTAVQTVAPAPAAPAQAATPPPGGSVSDALSGRAMYHGNFCGTATRVGVVEPVDELDAACKRHDDCYDISGHRSCTCDRQLKREALAIADSAQFSRDIRARAATIAQAAELMSCVGP